MKEKNVPKAKGGRPQKEESQKKSRIMCIRLQEEQYIEIKNKADESGLSISEYCLQLILNKKIKQYTTMKPEDLKLLRSLEGEANNLNQLARRAHANGVHSVTIEILKVLAQFRMIISKLSDDWKSYKRKKF